MKEISQLELYSEAWFDIAFQGMNISLEFRKMVEHLVRSYTIRGICDPGYIANVIAHNLGLGDGQGNFYEN